MKRKDFSDADSLLAFDLERHFWTVQPSYNALFPKIYGVEVHRDGLEDLLIEDMETGECLDLGVEPSFAVATMNGWSAEPNSFFDYATPTANPDARRIRATVVMSRFATRVICRRAGDHSPSALYKLQQISDSANLFEEMRMTLQTVSYGLVEP